MTDEQREKLKAEWLPEVERCRAAGELPPTLPPDLLDTLVAEWLDTLEFSLTRATPAEKVAWLRLRMLKTAADREAMISHYATVGAKCCPPPAPGSLRPIEPILAALRESSDEPSHRAAADFEATLGRAIAYAMSKLESEPVTPAELAHKARIGWMFQEVAALPLERDELVYLVLLILGASVPSAAAPSAPPESS